MTFEEYVRSIEPHILRVGIARIVAPPGWTPRARGYSDVDCLVPRPVRQLASGARGLYRTCLLEERPRHVAGRGGFAEGATAADAQAPGGPGADVDVRVWPWTRLPCLYLPHAGCGAAEAPLSDSTLQTKQDLERAFWKRVTYSPPLYGADVEGSLFDPGCPGWHLSRLDTVLQRTLAAVGVHIPGVTSPYLYWGSWRALFAWHTEDYDLYSVNYLHFGAPKTWYAIAPEHRQRFETAALSAAPELFRACPEFLRHKELLLSPQLLRASGVPFTRITQHPREFVITAPGAYHAGFNHGFNCAESTNFATPAWFPLGAKARSCNCQGARGEGMGRATRGSHPLTRPLPRSLPGDTVHIDMRLFGVEPQRARGAGTKRKAKGPASRGEEAGPEEDRGARPMPAKAPRPEAAAVGGFSHGQQLPPILTGTPVPESRLSLFRFPLVVRLAGIVMKPGGSVDGVGALSPPGGRTPLMPS